MTMTQNTVLNVDDHAGNRYVKTRILREAGFDVLCLLYTSDAADEL